MKNLNVKLGRVKISRELVLQGKLKELFTLFYPLRIEDHPSYLRGDVLIYYGVCELFRDAVEGCEIPFYSFHFKIEDGITKLDHVADEGYDL